MMQGRLWVESSEGSGSTFHFTAAFLERDETQCPESGEAGQQLQALPDPQQGADGERQPMRVLLVEDSDYNAYVVLAYLKHENCAIDIAKNGSKGLEYFMSQPYDLVLMDIRMPVMDGYAATRAMRSWERERELSPTPIVAMTAHAFAEDRQKCLDAGCDMHLSKPVSKRDLLRIVRRLSPQGGDEHREEAACGGFGSAEDSSETYPGEGPIRVSPDPDLAHVASHYLEALREELRRLRTALEKGDLQTAGQIGHRMKGEGQAFGFGPVSVLGAALQESCSAGNVPQTMAAVARLEDYVARVVLE